MTGWFSKALRTIYPPVHDENLDLARQECLARHAIASELERQAAERLIAILDQCKRPAALS